MSTDRSVAILRSKLTNLAAEARADMAVWTRDLEGLPVADYARVMPEASRLISQLAATNEGCQLLARQAVTVPGADVVALAYATGARLNLRRIRARRLDLFPKPAQPEASYT